MAFVALDKNGENVESHFFTDDEWEVLKQTYSIGDYTMLCCGADAVLKTSINSVKFFAHHTDDCTTAPETVWHHTAKIIFMSGLQALGLNPIVEHNRNGKWKADIYVKYNGREIAIELQHSYQSLSTFLKRQEKYATSNIEAYWILYSPVFNKLTKATVAYLRKNKMIDFDSKVGTYTFISQLPVLYLETDDNILLKGGGLFSATVDAWLKAVLEQRFVFANGLWKILEL